MLEQKENAMRSRKADWWGEAEMPNVKGMDDALHITELCEVRLVKHIADRKCLDAWFLEESKRICAELDDASGKDFASVWLHLGGSSLLLSCEFFDRACLSACLANDPLAKRLKMVLSPVQVKLPFPAKGPKDAETVGSFFGKSASLQCTKGSSGGEVMILRIDIYSKWMFKIAMQNVGFRIGNIIEILIVDWAGPNEAPGVLAACRLSVTEEFMKLLA
jgi:hypothetical protein